MAKNLVIVESPAKAKTINKILGRNYQVKASYGHVRDLPKSKLGVDVENGFEPSYVTLRDKSKVIKELRTAAKKAETIYLAADPDREGESICYHVAELLKKENSNFKRVVFNEITKTAVKRAFEQAGEVNFPKVEAQQARRILDRLVGYKLSPLLWRKVRRGLSAGRVQSVALKLIVEREAEIKAFNIEEYWKIAANLLGKNEPSFAAQVHKYQGKKVNITNKEGADAAVDYLNRQDFVIDSISVKPRKRNSPPPFITSTLQQDAFRKLGFPVAKTMRVAQRLYEGLELGNEGHVALITYMRTDSTRVADEAKVAASQFIKEKYGDKFLGGKPVKRKASKGMQDAHEAIRPNYVNRTPESLRGFLDDELFRLYQLIWNRFMASQMAPALFEATSIDINAGDYLFRSTGSRLLFKGFLEVLGMDKDKDGDTLLPELAEGENLKLLGLDPTQHFTQPPARYSEAGLVKELESRGIGRPSTYSSIISVIINRSYVDRKEKRLHPTELGEIVTDLLGENFHDLMDYEYTARMEEMLDAIEGGNENWQKALGKFNDGFSKDLEVAEEKMRNLKAEVEKTGEKCKLCGADVVIKWGRFGKFKACSEYPECKFSSPLDDQEAEEWEENGPMGKDPATGKDIFLKKGPYGPYLQLGEEETVPAKTKGKTKKVKPKRISIPKGKAIADVDMEYALKMLSLPREVGQCPETGKIIRAGLGRFGPYVERDRKFKSLGTVDQLFTVTVEEAVELFKKAGTKVTIQEFQDGISVIKGRYGPYITDGSKNAKIPGDLDPEAITFAQAKELLDKAPAKKKKTTRKKKK